MKSNFFAVNSNAEVIDFVSRNPDALGIVSVNWISDKDDSLRMSFIKKVNILAVSQQFINDGSVITVPTRDQFMTNHIRLSGRFISFERNIYRTWFRFYKLGNC